MKAAQLLEELLAQGVELWVEGDTLQYEAPPGVMTPRMIERLRPHKQEVMELVATREEAAQVLASPIAWREVLRPDLREPLGLAPLDADPPEAPPLPRVRWVRDLGCWQDGHIIISTVKTREARDRYYEAKACAEAVEMDLPLWRKLQWLGEEDTSMFRATVRQVLKVMPPTNMSEVQAVALASTLIELGRDPETGLPDPRASRERPPLKHCAEVAHNASPQADEPAQVLEQALASPQAEDDQPKKT